MAIRKSSNSGIPFGNTAGRPASPSTGQPYFNGEVGRLELYTLSSSWQNIVQETPGISSITGSYNESSNSGTFVITGNNFLVGAIAYAIGTNSVEYVATSTTYNSSNQLSATFNNLSAAYEPYDIKILNTSNLSGVYLDAFYINQTPTWSTSAGDLFSGITIYENEVSSSNKTLVASDPEGTALTYSIVSGPSGISIGSSTGILSGTFPSVSADTTYSLVASVTDGSNAINRTFSTTVINDPSLDYLSNLKMWIRGGYNGATSGNITAGSNTFAVPRWGSSSGNLNVASTVARIDSSATNSPCNSASNKWIRDGAIGSTTTLQDDKLMISTIPNSYFWQTLPSDNSIFDASTPNATFSYWMLFENRSEVTSSSQLYTTFHSWQGTNANAILAHDWYTNGTGAIYLQWYRNNALAGSFTPTGIGGSNGGKGVWIHFALVTTSSTTKTYINGLEQANSLTSYNSWLSIGSAQGMNFAGRCDSVSAGSPVNGTTGTGYKQYGDIRYYNAALSSSAISAIYNKTRSSFA
jgi:hypothetical protein